MPNSLSIKKIDQLGKVVSGGTPSTIKPEYWGTDIPWITPKDLSIHQGKYISKGERSITTEGLNRSSATLVPKGTVLFSSRAPIGYIAIASNELSTNQGFKNIVPYEHTDTQFLFYLLKNNIELIKSQANGSTFIEVSANVFKNIEVQVPDYSYQLIIGEILSSFDDKIEINNKINSNLEELAHTLYKRWFVDFEFPNEEEKPYKSSGGEMVESELGLIPKGWEIVKLGELLKENIRGVSPKYSNDENGTVVINQRCIRNHNIHYEAIKYHDNEKKEFNSKFYHQEWDVLINSMGVGTLGRVAVSASKRDALIHSCITILRSNPKIITKELFAAICVNLEKTFEQLGEGSTGQTTLKKELIEGINIVLPVFSIQEKISELFNNIQQKIDYAIQENNDLSNIRNLLLPKLMSGEIEV